MKKFIICFASVLLMFSCSVRVERDHDLADCDLVFVVNSADGCGNMDEAITLATCDDGLDVTHVGMLEVSGNFTWVIDATPKHGVCRRSLEDFREECFADDSSSSIVVMRVKNLKNASVILDRAKSYLGREYDFSYLPENDKIYCSELIQFSFLDGDDAPMFRGSPMNFKGPDGEFPEFWVKLFEELGEPIPQGVEGTNPHDMMKSDILGYVVTLKSNK